MNTSLKARGQPSRTTTSSADLEGKTLVIFDGVCHLCQGSVNFIIKRDTHNRYVFSSMQSLYGASVLEQYNLVHIANDSFIVVKDGQYLLKSDAALSICKDLSGWWYMMRIFIYIPRVIRDAVYDLVAKHRYRIFGKSEACMMPTTAQKDKFR
ncbi:DUF393 domain-containing protein [Glaciecola sp. XM2]|jgi:predicted DCC family thiol-disulfide oxidoreductase YuxK|uniref:thiol-disulfide oxidoreductase DCC family protein n=1 Tax=Glaciecola sp. XM2 TaxID=1914931 RepID=UPI001BDEC79F|nr:DCC1-like thiol-disulfide oxidoreductase family protein [Glaciecola sp. XM2]MBT1449546.1 DUF393 domain-containing protein [Glaciecola sp. XM2]